VRAARPRPGRRDCAAPWPPSSWALAGSSTWRATPPAGGLYLTPSRGKAGSYARHNRFGSELFTKCAYLVELIEAAPHVHEPAFFKDFPDLLAVLRRPGTPVVVSIGTVAVADLLDEGGGSAEEPLGHLLANWIGSAREDRRRLDAISARLKSDDPAVQAAAVTDLQSLQEKGLEADWFLEVPGQQMNFESRGVYSTDDLTFYDLPDEPAI
jgi:hypothetical protein